MVRPVRHRRTDRQSVQLCWTGTALRLVSVHSGSKGEHLVSHLSGYKGWVHADGYAGFNDVFGKDKAS